MSVPVKTNHIWHNTIQSDSATPRYYFLARKKEHIAEAILIAEAENLKLRTVGSGHSFNNIACSNDCLLDISGLNDFLDMPPSVKPDIRHDKRYVHVEAGMSIREFNRGLDKRDLAIINMGGIDHQTLAGAISTGTHGTGKDLPSFPGMVESILLVSAGGKMYRVEPAGGISNPLLPQEENVQLVQDDDHFNSMMVGLGAFGVVYSFVIRTVPMYWLLESKRLHTWENVRERLISGGLFRYTPPGESQQQDYRSIMVNVNPYRNRKGERNCIVVKHKVVPRQPRTIFEATRNVLTWLGNNKIVFNSTKKRFRDKPEKAPELIDTALKALKDKEYINRAHRVLYQGLEYVKERAYDAEFAFDINALNNSNWKVMDELFDFAAKFLSQHPNLCCTSPFGIRFVSQSNGYLSPEYNGPVCYIDTPLIEDTRGADELLTMFQHVMFQYNGIPHWGKKNHRLVQHLDKLTTWFPKLPVWQQLRDEYDPKQVFVNEYLEKFGLVKWKADGDVIV